MKNKRAGFVLIEAVKRVAVCGLIDNKDLVENNRELGKKLEPDFKELGKRK